MSWRKFLGLEPHFPNEGTNPPEVRREAAWGQKWEGLTTYTTDPEIGRPGFYALEDDGHTLHDPVVMLSWIDEAPDDEEDGSGHFIVANPDDPYYSHRPPHLDDPRYVELEAQARGTGGVSVA